MDRGKIGSRHHVIVEAYGLPMAWHVGDLLTLADGNRNRVTELVPLVQAVPPVRGRRGIALRRP
ncbi:hypothetical protein AB0M57_19815 [Streptomyces sp. NPDC051597]|uniref:hypothetical protein n=1 Tax=Streptomyces sp. NPDC051597 TaxID=3155049 RepID=UPI003435003D